MPATTVRQAPKVPLVREAPPALRENADRLARLDQMDDQAAREQLAHRVPQEHLAQ